MASKSVLELAVGTSKWDSGLKKAKDALNKFTEANGGLSKALQTDADKMQKFVGMMGKMDSTAKTAKGQMNDYKSTIEQLTMQYNRMSEAQKKTIGQDYLKSIDQIKQKYQAVNEELNDINAELGNTKQTSGATSQALEALAGKFGLNVSALTKLGGALAVAGGAVKVATDAFMQNESNVDSWGRTVEATGSIYQSFLQSLNNSDFSGFLSGIGRVIQAAKDAYNAMDELNTRMTIINPERAKLQARQTQLKATIRRKGADSAEGKAAQDELKKMEPQLVKSYQTEAKMNRDAFAAALRQRLAEGNIKVSESEFGALLSTFSDDRKFRQFRANAKGSKGTKVVGSAYSDSQQIIEYDTRNKNQRIAELITDEWRQKYSPYLTASYNAQGQAYSTLLGDARYVKDAKGGTGGGSGRGGGKGDKTTVKELTEEQKLQQQINDLVQQGMTMDEKGRAAQRVKIAALQDQLQTYKDIENELRGITKQEAKIKPQVEKPTALDTFANSPVSEGSINAYLNALQQGIAQSDLGSGVQAALAAKLTEGDLLSQALQMAMDAGVQGADLTDVAQKIKDKMLEGGTMDAEQLQEFLDEINKYIENSDLKLKFDVDTESITNVAQTNIKDAEKMTQNWMKASSAINTVSSAMQSLEDPAAKVIGTIAQAIATMALSYAEASLMAAKNPLNAGWGWIAFAATGAATMISSIAAIHSATGYAEGGMIKGNSYSGDNIMANGGAIGLNAGELVLNKSQQYNLASQLEGDGNQGTTPSRPYVSGEQIYLGLNNYLRRSGRGEIITSR